MVQFVGAMSQPGRGRNDIPTRLKGHFDILNVSLPCAASVERIFGKIIVGHFSYERKFKEGVVIEARRLPAMTQALWEATKAELLPTPSKFFYNFNLRDLSRITQGLIKAVSDVVHDAAMLHQLWLHECTRVLADRFISPQDMKWFMEKTLGLLEEMGGAVSIVAAQRTPTLCFADFMRCEYPFCQV
jgi:dynein heavy chain